MLNHKIPSGLLVCFFFLVWNHPAEAFHTSSYFTFSDSQIIEDQVDVGLQATGGSGTLTIEPGVNINRVNDVVIDLQTFNYTVVNRGTIGGFLSDLDCSPLTSVCHRIQGFNTSGIRFDLDGQVQNFGEISGTFSGISIGGNGDVENSGTISGDTQGIFIGGTGTLTNRGTISSLGNAVQIGINTGGPAAIINSGNIFAGSGQFAILTGNGSDSIILEKGSDISGTISTQGGNDFITLRSDELTFGSIDTGLGTDTLVLEETGTLTALGQFSNLENLVMDGTDWTLGQSATFSKIQIDNGILRTPLPLTGPVTINSTGALIASNTLNGNITNHGSLTSSGAINGNVINRGFFTVSSILTGTVINSGRFISSGTINGDVSNSGIFSSSNTLTGTVTNHGSLTSSGTIVGNVINTGTFASPSLVVGDFHNNGTLLPGSSIGTFQVNGNYTHGSAGNLTIEFDDTHSDLLDVNGLATLNGGAVKFTPSGLLLSSNTYTFLQSGGLAGNFNTVASPLLFDVTVNMVGNNMKATITRKASYQALAATNSQKIIARALDTALNQATGELAEVLAAIDQSVTVQDFQNAIDQFSTEPASTLAPATFANSQLYSNTIVQRLSGRRQGTTATPQTAEVVALLAFAGDDPDQLAKVLSGSTRALDRKKRKQDREWRYFARTFGNFSTLDSEGANIGFTANTFGLSLGVDKWTNDRWILGGSFGWSNTGQNYDLPNWDTSINSLRLAGHASYTGGHWYADGILSYALNIYDSERIIQVGGFNRTAEGSHLGNEFSLYLGGGYNLLNDDWKVGPIASIQYIALLEEGFEETGAGSAGLRFDSNNTNSLRSTLGFAASRRFTLDNETILIPEVSAQWAHELIDTEFTATAQFLGAAGSSFEINGRDLGRDSVFAGVGLSIIGFNGFVTTLNYNIDVGRSGFTSHLIDLRLSFGF